MRRAKLQNIAQAIASGHAATVLTAIDAAMVGETGKAWKRDMAKLAAIVADSMPRFSVFMKDGNSKLPFLAFSSLPGTPFCVGAGACLDYCYSFRAWRYPSAFCRQAQNAWLLQTETGRGHILTALDAFNRGRPIDFRLYVDGDFNDAATLEFWMRAISTRPWLRAYGYSKSFNLLLDYPGPWPKNYLLNISSGHRFDAATVDRVKALPIARGEFLAVSIGRKVKSSDHGKTETTRAIREALNGGRVFSCPGKCGTCTPRGHACGSDRFRGIPIAIAVH